MLSKLRLNRWFNPL